MDFIKGVDLVQRAKAPLQVVNDSPGHKSLRSIGSRAGPPVNVMVDGRLLALGIGEVRLLPRLSVPVTSSPCRCARSGEVLSTDLRVPEVGCEVVTQLAELEGNYFVHLAAVYEGDYGDASAHSGSDGTLSK